MINDDEDEVATAESTAAAAASIERVAVFGKAGWSVLCLIGRQNKLRLLWPFLMDRILLGWRQAEKKNCRKKNKIRRGTQKSRLDVWPFVYLRPLMEAAGYSAPHVLAGRIR